MTRLVEWSWHGTPSGLGTNGKTVLVGLGMPMQDSLYFVDGKGAKE
jgi:hypothetical protein